MPRVFVETREAFFALDQEGPLLVFVGDIEPVPAANIHDLAYERVDLLILFLLPHLLPFDFLTPFRRFQPLIHRQQIRQYIFHPMHNL